MTLANPENAMPYVDASGIVDYSSTTRCNRSLTASGRIAAFALLSATTFAIATLGVVVGAWPVLPFAGLEIVLLGVAFYSIGRSDGDYERLTIGQCGIRFERCSKGRVSVFECNREWARLMCRVRRNRCRLSLRSHGKEMEIGRLLNDEQRLRWASELRRRMRVVTQAAR
jgi:uncharacterized membrane protein